MLSIFSRPPLTWAPKAFKSTLGIGLVGFAEACCGQSLSMIIICQLSLEIVKGEFETQFQAFIWLAGILFSISNSKHLCTSAITDTVVKVWLLEPESPAQVLVPTSPLWFGQVVWVELCLPMIHMLKSSPALPQNVTLFRHRVAVDVIS